MNFEYQAKIVKDASNHYFVSFIDFNEAITEGETLEEALFNAAEALTLTIEGRIDEKKKVPMPSKIKARKDYYLVTPAARVQSALLFRATKKDQSIADIARILKTSWPAVARLEDPHHTPSLRQLEKAAHALGKQLVISFN